MSAAVSISFSVHPVNVKEKSTDRAIKIAANFRNIAFFIMIILVIQKIKVRNVFIIECFAGFGNVCEEEF